ncbi:hypothetical protein ACLKA6_001197 [Drosophila palustris]
MPYHSAIPQACASHLDLTDASIPLELGQLRNTIIQELVLATSAYRTAAVAKNPFSVRLHAPDNSPLAMITSPPPAKRQCNEAPF